MAFRQARSQSAASSVLSLLTLAAIGAWTHPAHASSGVDTLCDRSTGTASSLDVPPAPLMIEVVDHGSANSVAAGDPAVDSDIDANVTRQLRPRTDATLRRIFDEARLPDPDEADLVEPDTLTGPMADEQSSEVEEAETSGDVPAPGDTVTHLPGVSEDELMRFRKRMYRVDI